MATGFDLASGRRRLLEEATVREKDKVLSIFFSNKIQNIDSLLDSNSSLSCCGCLEKKAFNSCPKGNTEFLLSELKRFNVPVFLAMMMTIDNRVPL